MSTAQTVEKEIKTAERNLAESKAKLKALKPEATISVEAESLVKVAITAPQKAMEGFAYQLKGIDMGRLSEPVKQAFLDAIRNNRNETAETVARDYSDM